MGYRAAPNSPKDSKGRDKYFQGKYELINPEKYLGSTDSIYYRSSWEYKLYHWIDINERVLKWNVEGITIPYEYEENGKWTTHRYFPDVYCEVQKLDGTISKTAIEIKPYNETIAPETPKKETPKSLINHEYRLRLFLKNINKWKTAKEFCERRGIDFIIITEKFFDDKNVKIF